MPATRISPPAVQVTDDRGETFVFAYRDTAGAERSAEQFGRFGWTVAVGQMSDFGCRPEVGTVLR